MISDIKQQDPSVMTPDDIENVYGVADRAQILIDLLHKLHAYLAPSLLVLFAILPPLRIILSTGLIFMELLLLREHWQKQADDPTDWKQRFIRLSAKASLGALLICALVISSLFPHLAIAMFAAGVFIEAIKDAFNLKFHMHNLTKIINHPNYNKHFQSTSPQRFNFLEQHDALSLQVSHKSVDCLINLIASIGSVLFGIKATASLGVSLLLGSGITILVALIGAQIIRFVATVMRRQRITEALEQVKKEMDKADVGQQYKLFGRKQDLCLLAHDHHSNLLADGIKISTTAIILTGVILTLLMANPFTGLALAGAAVMMGAMAVAVSQQWRARSRELVASQLVIEQTSLQEAYEQMPARDKVKPLITQPLLPTPSRAKKPTDKKPLTFFSLVPRVRRSRLPPCKSMLKSNHH